VNQSSCRKVGIWIAGVHGDISATLIVGALALTKGLTSQAGLTSELPPMNQLPLATPDNLVFGGIDISDASLVDTAESLYRTSRTVPRELLDAVAEELTAINEDILVNSNFRWNPTGPNPGLPTLSELADEISSGISAFRDRHSLSHVVVVNLTSSEPEPEISSQHATFEGLQTLINENRKDQISPGILYSYAALSEGCSYLNFTPNHGTTLGGIRELANQRNLPFYGNDGKTGETLVKTALAPMFAFRNLQVLSWEGVNMLGNNDGKALNQPANRVAKLRNKGNVLENILGYEPHSGVDINYVPSLGDWKTAWDLIHFQGFLDVKMSMQFTWQGCDSILAAPLVLDMVRFSEFAARNGEAGPMRHLASFFKDPMDVPEMALHTQFERLLKYTEKHLSSQRTATAKRLNQAG